MNNIEEQYRKFNIDEKVLELVSRVKNDKFLIIDSLDCTPNILIETVIIDPTQPHTMEGM